MSIPLHPIKGREFWGIVTAKGVHLLTPDRPYPRLDSKAACRVCADLRRVADWTQFETHADIPPRIVEEVREVVFRHSITAKPKGRAA